MHFIKGNGDKSCRSDPLKEEIKRTIQELEEVRAYFNFIEDPDLLEYTVYKEKALLAKISFLIKKAKSKGKKGETACIIDNFTSSRK